MVHRTAGDGFFFAQLKVGILVEVISVIASVEKESEIHWEIQWICWIKFD